jgi:hypothetical protein
MIDLNLVDPKELFTDSWFEEYQIQKKIIGYELAELNACLLVLRKINAFPFHIFAPYREKSTFWELTSTTYFKSAVMTICKVWIDPNKEGLTLQRFKNEIMQNLQDQGVRTALQNAWRQVECEGKFSPSKSEMWTFRSNIVAHWNRDWLRASDEFRHTRAIDLCQLQSMADMLKELFQLLCFGSDFITLPQDYYIANYNPGYGIDIDELLDDIARKSRALYWPEEKPHLWQEQKVNLSPDDIETFNQYRKKFGLATA